jgi:hypothetical protein
MPDMERHRGARVPLPVLRDVIQPFPTFSEIYVAALKALHSQITARPPADGKPWPDALSRRQRRAR